MVFRKYERRKSCVIIYVVGMGEGVVSRLGLLRLAKEIRDFGNLPEYIFAAPGDNLREIHFVIAYLPYDEAAPATRAYADGVYWFKLKIPAEYPFSAPALYVMTPSGRFVDEGPVCTSDASFHNRDANRGLALTAYMLSLAAYVRDDANRGSIGFYKHVGSPENLAMFRAQCAAGSMAHNLKFKAFREAFPGLGLDRAENVAWMERRKAEMRGDVQAVEQPEKREREESPEPLPEPAPKRAHVLPVEATIERRAATWVIPPPVPRPALLAPPDFGVTEIVDAIARVGEAATQDAQYGASRQLYAQFGKSREVASRFLEAQLDEIKQRNVPDAPPLDTPISWAGVLYAHQRDALPVLLAMDGAGGGVLADPPGFGKTYMIAALIRAHLEMHPNSGHTIVVAQRRLHANWAAAIVALGIEEHVKLLVSSASMQRARSADEFVGVARVVYDEAHLRAKFDRGPFSQWYVSATPGWDGVSNMFPGRALGEIVLRRRPEENTAAVPPVHDVLHVLPATDMEMALSRSVTSLQNLIAVGARTIGSRMHAAVRPVFEQALNAMTLGIAHEAADEARKLLRVTTSRLRGTRISLNVPQNAESILERANMQGDNTGTCQVCAKPVGGGTDAVIFEQCAHIVCVDCFNAINVHFDKHPTCGLPCGRCTYNEVALLSVLRNGRPAPPARDPPAGGHRVREIVRTCESLRNRRVAVVVRGRALLFAVCAELRAAGHTHMTISSTSAPERLDRVMTAMAKMSNALLVVEEIAMRVGVNMQHFHDVLFVSAPLSPPVMLQIGARFVRPCASVDSVTFHHFYARDTFEARVYERFFDGERTDYDAPGE